MLQSLFVFLYFQYVQKSRKFGGFQLWLCITAALVLLSFSVPLILADFSPPTSETWPPTPPPCRCGKLLTPAAAAVPRMENPAGMRIPQSPWELGPFLRLHSLHREDVKKHKMDGGRCEGEMHAQCSQFQRNWVKMGHQRPHFCIYLCFCVKVTTTWKSPWKAGSPLEEWKPLKFCFQHIILFTVSLLTGFPARWPHSALFSSFFFKYWLDLIKIAFLSRELNINPLSHTYELKNPFPVILQSLLETDGRQSEKESNGKKNKEFSSMTWFFKLHLASNSRLALMLHWKYFTLVPLNIDY